MPSTYPHRHRLGFAGTPPFAATILLSLLGRHEVAVVYCQPARPTGRGRKLSQSAVEEVARSNNIAVRTPTTLREEAAVLAADGLDVLVVAAYGLILPKRILDVPRHGCINVHASLLPRWRGAAPIERSIMAGDTMTGISIMQMDEGLDTGPVLLRTECAIRDGDTGDSLRERLATLGSKALANCLEQLGVACAQPQPDAGATYASKLLPEDSRIDWAASATDIALKIRALNSRQPACCWVGGERVRLLFATALPMQPDAAPGTVISIDRSGLIIACGAGCLRVTQIALSRGKGTPMDVASLINGYADLIRAGQSLAKSS